MNESALKETITQAMKQMMRAQEKSELGVIRLILSEIKQIEIDQRIVLSDEQVLAVLDKMLKQRRESIKQFDQAHRKDLADKEQYEISIIEKFLPPALSEGDIQDLISAAIEETQAQSIKDMARVMAILKPKLQGKADIGAVGVIVKGMLAAAH